MELYILDRNFRDRDVIDQFESLIWTERYSDAGDFTMVVKDSPKVRDRLKEGTLVRIPSSKDAALIETKTTKNGLATLVGPLLSGYLKQKILRSTWLNAAKSWELTGAPGWMVGEIVRQMCSASGIIADGTVINTSAGVYEPIPNLVIGPTPPGSSQTRAIEFGNVFDAVKKLCDEFNYGFRLYPANVTETSYQLVFSVYAGLDRTSAQSVNQIVRFDPKMDTLTDIEEVRSIADYKTVCYAWAPNITTTIYTVGVAYAYPGAVTLTGFDRRSLLLTCDDINPNDPSTDTGAALKNLLNKRAANALANNNYVRMVDGQIIPQKTAAYGSNYSLGDIVELRGPSGSLTSARVIEYIQAQDSNGYSAYPTLSVVS